MTNVDPFERAVEHERSLRRSRQQRAMRDAIGLATAAHFALIGVWAIVLAGHYWLFGGKTTLFTIHAVLFALFTGGISVTALTARSMLRRMRRQQTEVDFP